MSVVWIVICALLIVAPMIFTLGAIIYGAIKKARALRPVEYYAPRGYSPIDVLIKYYGHNADAHRLLNPLMLYWAHRGFITIEEDCKRGLKLTKLKALEKPDTAARFTKGQSKNFEIEKALFDDIFSRGKTFYTLAASPAYSKSVSDFIAKARDSAKASRSGITQKFSVLSLVLSIAALIITTVVCGVSYGSPLFLAMIFPIVGIIAFNSIPGGDGLTSAIKYPFFAVWGGAPFAVVVANAPVDAAILLGVAELFGALTVTLLAKRIDIRTDKAAALYGRIMSFREFLLDVEADKLELLVEENPDYFYDILPFCYVLDITKKLRAKFDRITLDEPSWYLGDLRDTLMF